MWNAIKRFFLDSETIFWARLQLAIGAAWEVLIQTDMTTVIPPDWMPWWLMISGIVTEFMRRRRDPDLGKE